VLYDLQEALELKVVPRLIACFDISHMQGTEVVGSCVVFRNGEPDKSEYRRFRIRGDWGNDDYRSMEEVVSRYLSDASPRRSRCRNSLSLTAARDSSAQCRARCRCRPARPTWCSESGEA
jgi:hypothetical protein